MITIRKQLLCTGGGPPLRDFCLGLPSFRVPVYSSVDGVGALQEIRLCLGFGLASGAMKTI